MIRIEEGVNVMKTIFRCILIFTFTLCSFAAYADKITITGEPVVVTEHGSVYVPATTLSPADSYFFSVDNAKRVCYKDVQPGLASVDLGVISVQVGADNVSVHCYTYSPDYFVMP